MENNNSSEIKSRIKKLFSLITSKLGEIQNILLGHSQKIGSAKDRFELAQHNLESIPDDPMLEGVEKILSAEFQFIQGQEADLRNLLNDDKIGIITDSAITTASSVTASAISIEPTATLKMLFSSKVRDSEKENKCINRFSALNQELGKTYSSVWEIFYGTTKQPEKNALPAMRQAFDQFFRIIAPDDEVRMSPYFETKEGEKPNQIYRSERLRYAANTKVKDKSLTALLEAQASQALEIYDKLQKLHVDTSLKRDNIKEVLCSMQDILELWLDAIDLFKS